MTGSGPWELTVSVLENGKEGWPRKLLTNEPRVSSLLKGSGGDTTGETSIASGWGEAAFIEIEAQGISLNTSLTCQLA